MTFNLLVGEMTDVGLMMVVGEEKALDASPVLLFEETLHILYLLLGLLLNEDISRRALHL
jgi:hypothetical protein